MSRIGYSMITVPHTNQVPVPTLSRHNSEGNMGAPLDTFRATQKSLKAIAARFSPSSAKSDHQGLTGSRRATLPTIPPSMGMHTNPSSTSLSSVHSEPSVTRSEPTLSPLIQKDSLSIPNKYRQAQATSSSRNIDYLSFSANTLPNYSPTTGVKNENPPSDWERFLSSIDNGQANIYDSIYGGPPVDSLLGIAQHPTITNASATLSPSTFSPNGWNWESYSEQAPPPQSVLSFSDESLTSGEEFGSNPYELDLPSGIEKTYLPDYINSLIGTGGLDANFGL